MSASILRNIVGGELVAAEVEEELEVLDPAPGSSCAGCRSRAKKTWTGRYEMIETSNYTISISIQDSVTNCARSSARKTPDEFIVPA
jgi:hypothetical protein